MDVSNLIWCFPADFIDSLYHLPHFDLKSVMESVMDDAPDPDDLRDDLMSEIIQLQGDLKHLGYDMVYIPDFLRRTGELALDQCDAHCHAIHRVIELQRDDYGKFV